MSWDEVRTRVGQEIFKRLDLVMYRTGIGSRTPSPGSQAHVNPRFFFDKDEKPAHRAGLLNTHLPFEAGAIIYEADEICRHEFRLLGYERVNCGRDIDWHSSQGKRGPLIPWFKINFLDFQAVGDHKVVWELNRHQHLVTLAKARLLTGNAAYTDELVKQWDSWQKANPYPLGINWASTLEVAFRSLSWLWIGNLLADCPDLPSNFQNVLLLALRLHGRHIERYLSTYFSPNTHLLGEAAALFFIGTMCPQIPASDRWRNRGWNILLQEAERQVRPDGVYFEQSLYYHVYAIDFFLHARILAEKSGIVIPERFDNVLKRMLNVVQGLSEVGPIEGFGDDDGGRVFNPRRNRVECMTDPLALGTILYDRDEYAAASLTEESVWLFGDQAIEALGRPRARLEAASKAFPAGGIYLMNDPHPRAQQLMVDAGPQGTGTSGHGHADALSIRLSLSGRRFLVDPGTYCYSCGKEERDTFRGTGAHNTLRVDKVDQALSEGQFAWGSLPHVNVEIWLTGQTFDFFSGSHDGYRRLSNPVLHQRSIFHVKGGIWFVLDVAEGQGEHLLETFWHFAPDLEVARERGLILAKSSANDSGTERACLALLTDQNSAWTTEVTQGLVSPAYGAKQAAPIVRASVNATLPEHLGVLLVPMTRGSEAGIFAPLGESSDKGVRGYRYQTFQTTEVFFIARQNGPWACGPWSSDSKLLYCRLERGRFTHVIMVSGSFGEWRGKRFISQPSPMESFEWLSHPESKKAFCLGGTVLDDSVITDFEVLDSVP
jgi:hypothetical protein